MSRKHPDVVQVSPGKETASKSSAEKKVADNSDPAVHLAAGARPTPPQTRSSRKRAPELISPDEERNAKEKATKLKKNLAASPKLAGSFDSEEGQELFVKTNKRRKVIRRGTVMAVAVAVTAGLVSTFDGSLTVPTMPVSTLPKLEQFFQPHAALEVPSTKQAKRGILHIFDKPKGEAIEPKMKPVPRKRGFFGTKKAQEEDESSNKSAIFSPPLVLKDFLDSTFAKPTPPSPQVKKDSPKKKIGAALSRVKKVAAKTLEGASFNTLYGK